MPLRGGTIRRTREMIEQVDLELVLMNWGEALYNPYAAGWANDLPAGLVDQDELDAVLLNWGNTNNAIAAGVPEPSSRALFSACLVAVVCSAACRVRPRTW